MPTIIGNGYIQEFYDSGNNLLPANRGLVKLNNPSDGHDAWRYLSIGEQNLRLTHYGTGQAVTDNMNRGGQESLQILLDGCFLPLAEVAQMTGMPVQVTYTDVAHWTDVINRLRDRCPNPCQNAQNPEIELLADAVELIRGHVQAPLSPQAVKNPLEAGSKYWLQRFVNGHHDEFQDAILSSSSSLLVSGVSRIEWVSPLAGEDYAEYWDGEFLNRLGLRNEQNLRKLKEFWPNGGPNWDGLAKVLRSDHSTQIGSLLIEAKAHTAESKSSCKAGEDSKRRIVDALKKVAGFFGVPYKDSWVNGSYQLANRLAHLYFLREVLKHPAWLVYVLFANDSTNKPTSPRNLLAGFQQELISFGLKYDSPIIPYIIPVLIDVGKLTKPHE